MKKCIGLIVCFSMIFALAGCGGSDNAQASATQNQTAGVKDVLEAGIEAAENAEPEGSTETTETPEPEGSTETPETTGNVQTENAEAAADVQTAETAQENDADTRQSGVDETAHKPEEDVTGIDVSGESGEVDVDLTALSSTMIYSEVYNMLSNPDQYIGKNVKMTGLFNYFHDQTTDVYYFACIIEDATACCSQGIEFVPAGDLTYPDDYPEVYDRITVTGTFDTYVEGEYQYCTLRDAEMEVL